MKTPKILDNQYSLWLLIFAGLVSTIGLAIDSLAVFTSGMSIIALMACIAIASNISNK